MDKEFEAWIRKTDQHILAVTEAFDSGDLPDIAYWDLWESGVSPKEAAIYALENAGYPEDLLYE